MYDSYRYTTIQYHAEYTCSANHSVSSSHRHCTRKDRSIYTNKQTNRHWLEKTSTIQIQCRSAPPPSSVHFANCLGTLAGENTHHPDSVDLPPLLQSTSRIVFEHWLERTQHHPDTVTICPPPPSTVHFTHGLRALAGENTAPSRHSVDLPPPPFTVHFANCLRTLAGENTAPSRHSVDLLAPPQSTSRTVSSCL